MGGLALGFITRFLPDMFKGVGNMFKARAERKAEESAMRIQLQIEQAKAAGASDVAGINAESAEILAGIHGELDEIKHGMADRKDARKYGIKALDRLNETLQKGIDMGLSKFWLGLGYNLVLGIECLSASVQPMMAVIVFGMWIFHKKDNWVFGPQDWWLMEYIVGFFLGGRVKKHTGME
jgi:hypothetical protein